MIPERAIEKAIMGGWANPASLLIKNTAALTESGTWQQLALDPTFWQSLLPIGECHCGKDGHAIRSINCPRTNWKNRARDFYDLIVTGGDTQAFWDELLGK